MVKTAALAVVAVFVVFYAVTSPDHAADIASNIWNGLVDIAHGIGHFVDRLSS